MASSIGKQTPDLKEKLLKESPRFSFVQVLRLLRFISSRETDKGEGVVDIDKRIQVRPELTLDFPEADITSIEEIQGIPSRYLITATFLGLYGSSSPLPTFYTEDLFLEQSEDKTVMRDFLDIINAPLYTLFFECWKKYRLFCTIIEEQEPDILGRLYSFIGLEEEKLRDQIPFSYSLLRYMGFMTLFPRSAEGLRSLLVDSFNERSIRIEQCVERLADIPEDQRCILGRKGNKLGENSYLGFEITDRSGKFIIQAGPLDSSNFHRFMPDTTVFGRMSKMIRFYLDQPLVCDVELFINGSEIETTQPGQNRWSKLGWNTWIFSEDFKPENQSVILFGSNETSN